MTFEVPVGFIADNTPVINVNVMVPQVRNGIHGTNSDGNIIIMVASISQTGNKPLDSLNNFYFSSKLCLCVQEHGMPQLFRRAKHHLEMFSNEIRGTSTVSKYLAGRLRYLRMLYC